ncbi:uncharacterized protein LOC143459133 isoform X2 [Clavelina lepadiformis]|uniref:uncharacterized protein LOC143459133 isoform X2 n=1 Tax=Clavelina lepadiformis TaxID=159417 RepID=UPI00404248FE
MARVPPPTVDFAPAWLNFNNSSKRTDKANSLSGCSPARALKTSPFNNYPSNKTTKFFSRQTSVDSDKTWSILGGSENTSCCDEKVSLPGHTRSSNKWSFSLEHKKRSGETLSKNNSKNETTSLDSDFPSLSNGWSQLSPDREGPFATNKTNNMWDKPLTLKPADDELEVSTLTKTSSNPSQSPSNIYKNFVPKSSTSFAKPYRRAASVSSGAQNIAQESKSGNISRNYANSKKLNTGLTLQSTKRRDSPKSPSPVLSTSEDANPIPGIKRHRKGKTIFLRELRQDDDDDKHKKEFSGEKSGYISNLSSNIPMNVSDWDKNLDDAAGNAIDIGAAENVRENNAAVTPDPIREKVEGSVTVLSSSLEAEHRLLREMGWTQGEDSVDEETNAGLTDAEIREFFLQNKRNGLLAVPSPSHRIDAFRDALSAWSMSGPVLRRITDEEKVSRVTEDHGSSEDSQLSSIDSEL